MFGLVVGCDPPSATLDGLEDFRSAFHLRSSVLRGGLCQFTSHIRVLSSGVVTLRTRKRSTAWRKKDFMKRANERRKMMLCMQANAPAIASKEWEFLTFASHTHKRVEHHRREDHLLRKEEEEKTSDEDIVDKSYMPRWR